MTATRIAPDELTDPSGIAGDDYADRMKAEVDPLWNGVITHTSTVAGTAAAITAVSIPPLVADPVQGQTFRLLPTANNTGATTINLDARGAIALKDHDGDALQADDIVDNRAIEFWYDDDNNYYRLSDPSLRAVAAAAAAAAATSNKWVIIADTTIGAPVSQVEHTFVAGTYTAIKMVISSLSASGNISMNASLRHAGGSILLIQTVTGFSAASNDALTTSVEIAIGLVAKGNGTYQHTMYFVSDEGLRSAVAEDTTQPNRVRVHPTSGNLTEGRIITYGLKP